MKVITKWKIRLRRDLVRTKYLPEWGCSMVYEFYWVIASRRGRHFIHQVVFRNDLERARGFVRLVRSREDFSPECSQYWSEIRDVKQVRVDSYVKRKKEDWREYLDLFDRIEGRRRGWTTG